MSVEERLTELEIRLAYQEKVIAALDEVVRDFAARVERVERWQKEREQSETPFGPPDEPPPHY
jgi:uncharacterized coiled-coil protein SlyX